MKKLAVLVMTVLVALTCSLAFVSCTDDASAAALVMNKRYIQSSYVNDTENQRYYVFHANGTGEYTYHYDYDSEYDSSYSEHSHYKIHFKYTYVDQDKSAVVCFYDSMERLDGDNGKANVSTSWSNLLTVSKNVLSTAGTYGYNFWINEDYLKTIPHFGEKTA